MKKILLHRIQTVAAYAILCLFLISSLLFSPCNSLHAEVPPRYTLSDEILSSPAKLKPFLDALYQYTLDHGIKNFYSYSHALIKESYKAIDQKQYDKALILSGYAEKLSPDLPAASIALSKVQWANNKLLIFQVLHGYGIGFLKQTRDLESISYLLVTTLCALLGTFCLTVFLFCTISLIKYFPTAVHDVKHLFLSSSPQIAAIGWTCVLFLLPLFLNFSIFWAALMWLALLFSYQTKHERRVTLGIFILCAFIPWVFFTLSFALNASQSVLIKTLWNSNYGYWDTTDIKNLKSLNEVNQDNREILFTLGLIHKKDNDYASAEAYYQKVLSLKTDDYSAHVNLGNVFFATKRLDKAIDEYNRAIAINPSQVSSHFNLSRAYLQKFMFPESEAEFMKATTLDSATISHYLNIYSENPNRFLIDESLTRSELWNKAVHYAPSSSDLSDRLWDLIFRGIPRSRGSIIAFCLLGVLLLSATDSKFRIAHACKSCGTVTCRRCRHINLGSVYCPQCMSVFEKKETLNPLLRERKILDIKTYIQRNLRVINCFTFVFPGTGYVWKGYPITGSLLTLLFLFLFFKIIFSYALIEDPGDIITPPSLLVMMASIVLVIGAGIIIAWLSYQLKEDNDKIMSQMRLLQKPVT